MPNNSSKRKIAVVDDESGLLDLFQEILSQNYEVVPFASPKNFLDYLSPKNSFEVLISDLKMPGMTGIEMICEAQKRGFFFPSILLSGHLDKKSVFKAVDLGVYRLIEKPMAPETLINAIEELITEYDIRDIRHEIRQITGQLKEYYSFLRLLIANHIPEADVKNFALQANHKGQIISHESFDSLLARLETRLDKLLRSENILEEVRAKRYKNIA